ncbi:putative transcription factor ARF family [Helianthus anomalus]
MFDRSIMVMNNEDETCLDSGLWHACAGGMVQMPRLNSKVFYFPQGHAEHVASPNVVDFGDFPQIPPYVLCRVSAITYMADPDTDEVYAKMRLIPLINDDCFDSDDDDGVIIGFDQNKNENQEHANATSFAKTLTQSDANNGGGFSVPRYCAETIFPRLDYTVDPPLQNILAKDVHGNIWKFRHIYRGTPRRHLLTTGWSTFVNKKNLVAGDSIVFLRAHNGDICVGIRRVNRGFNNGRFCGLIKERGKLSGESVIEAAKLAANGQPFEVFYYPGSGSRLSAPEFCVKASTVVAAMRIQWCQGMRFKMAFETEDSSRISYFTGTVSSVHATDHIHWPNSPWRLLQVSWDEPDLLQNVKRVSPWLVEIVPTIPAIHLSPPRKKPKLTQPPEIPLTLSLITDNNYINPGSIQGARHNNNPQFDKILSGMLNDPLRLFPSTTKLESNGNVEKDKKKPVFMLFGQPIFTEQQLVESWSGDDGSVVLPVESSSSEEAVPWLNEPNKALISEEL